MKLKMAVLLLTLPAASWAATVSGSIKSVDSAPISTAMLTINDRAIDLGDSGTFIAVVDSDVFSLHISAPNYYSIVQTYSRADLQLSLGDAIEIPPIVLVRKAKNRRLLVFAGDTMMGRRFLQPRPGEMVLIRPESAEEDMKSVLQHMKPYLDLADLTSVNLETQLSATPMTESLPKSVAFQTHTAIAPALRWAGVDYVALGNNHTFDFLDVGLERTLGALKDAELGFSGAGFDDGSAREPHVEDMNNLPVHLYSYVGWPGTFEPNQVASASKGGAALGTSESIVADMRSAPVKALTVMQYHSGLEYVSEPPLAEETQLKLAVDSGADIAIGHHSHVIQGLEVYKKRLIAYSLGNFVFDQYIPSTQAGMLLFAWYDDNQFYRAEIVPLHINGYIPTPATGVMRYDILQRLARLSSSSSTCVGSSGGHLIVRPCDEENSSSIEQKIQVVAADEALGVRRLSALGAEPVAAVSEVSGSLPYRLGLDLLRRGDFEYSGLFGTVDRTWIESPAISIIETDSKKMRIQLQDQEDISTGMKVFTRVFSRSNPATVSANVNSDGCARLTFSLQRRPDGVGFEEALLTGPTTMIGRVDVTGGEKAIALDFQLPRTFTRGIRLLVDAERCDSIGSPAAIELDELAIVEWQTPWLEPGAANPRAAKTQATHVQFRP